MVLLGAQAGLRIHEIAKLQWENINLATKKLRINGKGGMPPDFCKEQHRPRKLRTAKDAWNEQSFAPVTTTALRLRIRLQSDGSAGVLEWEVR